MATPFTTATEFLRGSFENYFTQLAARMGGPAAADFTMRTLAEMAQEHPELARRIFDLIKTVEKPAELAVGGLDTLLPIIEKNGGALGALARTSRGFFVNVLERGLTRYFEQLKTYADADNFDGFKDEFDKILLSEADRLTPASGKVWVVALTSTHHVAYKDQKDPAYVATMATMKNKTVINISSPKTGDAPKVTEFKLGKDEVKEYELDFKEALRHPYVVFNQSSFPDLVEGMQGGTLARRAGGSAWSQVSQQTREEVLEVLSKLSEKMKGEGRDVLTDDQISQIRTHCREPKILEMIADAGDNLEKARIALLIAGHHASADMVAAQQAKNVTKELLESYEGLKKLSKKGFEKANEWIEEHEVVDKAWKYGKWSAWAVVLSIPLWVVGSITSDFQLGAEWRIAILLMAVLLVSSLVLWLRFVGATVDYGMHFMGDAGAALAKLVNKVANVDMSNRHDLVDEFGGGRRVISSLGNQLGIVTTLFGGLLIATVGIEGARLHALAQGARLMIVAFFFFGMAGAFLRSDIKNKWAGGMVIAQNALFTLHRFLTFLQSKPGVFVVVLVPLAVVGIRIGLAPQIVHTGQSWIKKAGDSQVRFLGARYDMDDLFKEARHDVKFCKMHDTAHFFDKEAPASFLPKSNTRIASEEFTFSVESLSNILSVTRGWRQYLVAKKDTTLNEDYFELMNGEEGAVASSFPDAEVDVEHGGLVRIPPELISLYQASLPGSERADYEYQADGRILAKSRVPASAGPADTAMRTIWDWIDGKSAWALLGFMMVFAFLGTIISWNVNTYFGAVGYIGALLCLLFAVLT